MTFPLFFFPLEVLQLCIFCLFRLVESSGDFWHRQLVLPRCQSVFARVLPCPRIPEPSENFSSLLKGITLNVGVIEGGDFGYDCGSFVEDGEVRAEDSYSMFLLNILQHILQFEIRFLSSTEWGVYENFNETWSGLLGFLASNTTQMIGCHWTVTQGLTNVADFLFSTMETTESFVYLPENLPLKEDVFVTVLSRKLWVFFLLCIFLLIASFWFSTFMHSRVRPDHEPWGWDEVALWAVAAIAQQSCGKHPRGSSCRTTFLIGYLITYLLYTSFAAGITSLLALQSHRTQLTFQEVADMKLNLILHKHEYHKDLFQMPGSPFSELNNDDGEGESLPQIFYKIKQTNFLGFGSTVSFFYYLHSAIEAEDRENFLVVSVPDSNRRKAFAVGKSFKYKNVFNFWLLRLRESGLLDLGRKRYLNFQEPYRNSGKWFSAGLGHVFSAVVFLLLGWILSVCVLLLEIFWSKRTRKPEKKRS